MVVPLRISSSQPITLLIEATLSRFYAILIMRMNCHPRISNPKRIFEILASDTVRILDSKSLSELLPAIRIGNQAFEHESTKSQRLS